MVTITSARPRRLAVAGAAIALAVALLSTSAAVPAGAASSKLKVTLTGTSSLSVPAQAQLTWKVTLPKKAKKPKYLLQQKSGSTWKTVKTLTKKSGTVAAPKATKLGLYEYRVVASAKVGKKTSKVTSKVKGVRAYGQVDLAAICDASGTVLLRCKNPGSIFIGDNPFAYVTKVYGDEQILNSGTIAHSCRSISLRFSAWESVAPGTYGPYYNSKISIAQGSTAVGASAKAGQIGTLNASLKPGVPFTASMQMSSDDGMKNYVQAGINGTASCYTANGIAKK